jgi:phosphohistidine phosphatase
MKQLYLIRHAKSDWDAPYKSDFERGLNKRGKKAITTMANALMEKGVMPDLILSSSATRAKLTAEGLAKALEFQGDIAFIEGLYLCSQIVWMELIQTLDEKYENVFIIGHNPEITNLTNRLVDDYIDNVPTLGIVGLDVKSKQWHKFRYDSAKLDFFIYPKLYKNSN